MGRIGNLLKRDWQGWRVKIWEREIPFPYVALGLLCLAAITLVIIFAASATAGSHEPEPEPEDEDVTGQTCPPDCPPTPTPIPPPTIPDGCHRVPPHGIIVCPPTPTPTPAPPPTNTPVPPPTDTPVPPPTDTPVPPPTDTPVPPPTNTPRPPSLSKPPAPAGLGVTSTSRASIGLDWNSRSGISKYRISYGSTTKETASSAYTATGLTCGASYDFSVSAYGNGTRYRAVWGPSVSISQSTESCRLAAPTNLTITPLSLRKARLTWTGGSNADGYAVEVRKQGGSWQAPDNGNSSSRLTDGRTTAAYYKIQLDGILDTRTSAPSDLHGLAHAPAYEFRVKAKAPSSSLDSAYSDELMIIDSPLLTGGRAYGGDERAELEWVKIPDVIQYTVRYRELGERGRRWPIGNATHKDQSWPDNENWPYYGDFSVLPAVSQPSSGITVSTTVSSLDRNKLYAFQVNYEYDPDPRPGTEGTKLVFAARDAFVWPSGGVPSRGERVGTYHTFGYWEDGDYEYTICSGTFPDNPITPRVNENSEWVALIEHAFEQWEEAVPDRVEITHQRGNCSLSFGPIETPISLENQNPFVMVWALGNGTNEVYAVDTSSWYDIIPAVIVGDNALFYCVLGGTACVISSRYWDPFESLPLPPGVGLPFVSSIRALGDGSVDVLVNSDRTGRGLRIPDDVSFNTCLPKAAGSDPDETYDNYQLMVHEAGHALGLSGFFLTSFWSYEAAHPTIPDAVMNYDKEVPRQIAPGDHVEPDCSPHPFDRMAIEALYQNTN